MACASQIWCTRTPIYYTKVGSYSTSNETSSHADKVVIKSSSWTKYSSNTGGWRKHLLQLCIAMVVICIIFYTYTQTYHPSAASTNLWSTTKVLQNILTQRPQANFLNSSRKRHLVLLWTPYFSRSDWLPSTQDLLCPVEACDVTSNRLHYNESSAVVMHWRNISPDDLPPNEIPDDNVGRRSPLLVLFNKEAPPHTQWHPIESINNRIHWVVTYRRDSDVYAPYGKIILKDHTISIPNTTLNGTGVCWLVSNCHTSSNREEYVSELKRFINVEVYGKCGNNVCPYEEALKCYKWLSERCKFYLSFENSICKDYSTEKLYFAMMSDMIPVVLGGDDYAKYLPEHSFINVEDFSNPEALAEYLEELGSDEARYLSYFNWKKKYIVQDSSYMWFCDLCEKLHQTELSNIKPRKDVIAWWFNQSECLSV